MRLKEIRLGFRFSRRHQHSLALVTTTPRFPMTRTHFDSHVSYPARTMMKFKSGSKHMWWDTSTIPQHLNGRHCPGFGEPTVTSEPSLSMARCSKLRATYSLP